MDNDLSGFSILGIVGWVVIGIGWGRRAILLVDNGWILVRASCIIIGLIGLVGLIVERLLLLRQRRVNGPTDFPIELSICVGAIVRVRVAIRSVLHRLHLFD